jgi:hypothetical protein
LHVILFAEFLRGVALKMVKGTGTEEYPTTRGTGDRTPFLVWFGFTFCLKCFAFSILMVMLLLSVLFTAFNVPLGIGPLSLGGSLKLIYSAAIVPIFALVGEILKRFSPWGFLTLVGIALILKGPAWIRESLRSARWKFGAFEYEGTEATSAFRKELNEAAMIVDTANKEIGGAYKSAKSYASQLRDRYQIGLLTSSVAVAVAKAIGSTCPKDYKLTLYLPDFVFGDRLFQFTEYYNKDGEQESKDQAGRTYSVRYGIIGRVWRSDVAEIEGELIPKDERELLLQDSRKDATERFIARRWGLSLEEAFHVKSYNSYGAIRLNVVDNKVGLIFFCSTMVNAFGDDSTKENTLKAIKTVLDGSPLIPKLLEIGREVAPWSGRIQIFRNP